LRRIRFSRRRLLREAAAPAVAAAIAVDPVSRAFAASGNGGPRHVGVITEPPEPRAATVDMKGGGVRDLVLADDAQVVHGWAGRVGDLTPFVVGEQVVVSGSQQGSSFVAAEVQSVYTPASGRIVADRGDGAIETSTGRLRLPAAVRTRANIGPIAPGASFSANVWTDPRNGERFVAAMRVARS
jgi:hypothetical protein